MDMKENGCRVNFKCMTYDCAYFKLDKTSGNHEYCIYDCGCCSSKVAQANAMILKLKEMGVE